MSENLQELDIIQELDSVLLPVKLERRSSDVHTASERPKGAEVWTSDYAVVAYCPATNNTEGTSDAFKDSCQAWLEELVRKIEGKEKGLLDAYLVIGLPEIPSEEIIGRMRRIVTSPDFSRKHFVWPISTDGPDGPRISRVSTLTLAAIPTNPTDDPPVELSDDEDRSFSKEVNIILEQDSKEIRSLASQFIDEVEQDG